MTPSFKEKIRKLFSIFPKLTGDMLIYGLGGSLAQLVGLITIPVISRIFISSDYGTIDIITATVGYFTVLMTLNIGLGMMRHFYEVSADAGRDRTKMVSSTVWFTLVFGCGVVWVVSLFAGDLSQYLFASDAYARAIVLAMASLPLVAVKEIFKSVLRMQRKPVQFLVINIVYAVINFLLILLFVLGFKQGITGYFAAQVISALLVSLLSAWQCRQFVRLTFSVRWFGLMAAYGVPMVPGGLFNWGMSSINRVLLTQYTTESQIAYYSMAIKATKVIELAVTAFMLAWLPVFLESVNSPTFHKKLDRVFRYYFYASISLSALVTVFAKEFFYILAPKEYLPGVPLVALLCLKHAFNGSTYTFTVGITKTNKTYLVSVATGLGVIATVVSSLLLSPRYGIFGAAVADLVGVAVFALAELVFSQRLVKLELNYRPAIWTMLAFLLMWLVVINVTLPNFWLDLLFRATLLAAFLVFVYVIIDRRVLLNKLVPQLKSILSKKSIP